jgi:hypothetical protein
MATEALIKKTVPKANNRTIVVMNPRLLMLFIKKPPYRSARDTAPNPVMTNIKIPEAITPVAALLPGHNRQ